MSRLLVVVATMALFALPATARAQGSFLGSLGKQAKADAQARAQQHAHDAVAKGVSAADSTITCSIGDAVCNPAAADSAGTASADSVAAGDATPAHGRKKGGATGGNGVQASTDANANANTNAAGGKKGKGKKGGANANGGGKKKRNGAAADSSATSP